jgi:hypothetical protein
MRAFDPITTREEFIVSTHYLGTRDLTLLPHQFAPKFWVECLSEYPLTFEILNVDNVGVRSKVIEVCNYGIITDFAINFDIANAKIIVSPSGANRNDRFKLGIPLVQSLYNPPMPPINSPGFDIDALAAAVATGTAASEIGGTYKSNAITYGVPTVAAAGMSPLQAKNLAATSLIVANKSNRPMSLWLVTTAVDPNSPTLVIPPGGSYETDDESLARSDIYVTCPQAGQQVTITLGTKLT